MFSGPMKLQVNGCNILGDFKKKKKIQPVILYYLVSLYSSFNAVVLADFRFSCLIKVIGL